MLLSILLYFGLLTALVGGLSLLHPFRWLGIGTRTAAAAALGLGLAVVIVIAAWPVRPARIGRGTSRIDAVMPICEFHETHAIHLHASRRAVFAAIRAVTPGEIRFFRTLMGIRDLPERLLRSDRRPALVPGYSIVSFSRRDTTREFTVADGPAPRRAVTGTATVIEYCLKRGASPAAPDTILARYLAAVRRMGGRRVAGGGCCRATFELGDAARPTWVELAAREDGTRFRLAYVEPPDSVQAATPILEVFQRSGFVVLAEEPDRELVLGSAQRYWQAANGPPPKIADAAEFAAFDAPDFAKVAFDLRVEDEGDGGARVTTETRVLTTDSSSRRKFAVYWRFIHPGSAIIRLSWLDAIRRRVERQNR